MDQESGLPPLKGDTPTSNDTGRPVIKHMSMIELPNPVSGRAADSKSLPVALERLGTAQSGTSGGMTLGDSERQQILCEWNRTDVEFPRDKCIHQMFEEQVARSPDAIALVFENDCISYSELNRRSNQLAHHLRRWASEPTLALRSARSGAWRWWLPCLAVIKAGGAYVPLDPSYPPDRLGYMLEDSAPAALLIQSHLAGVFANEKYAGQIVDLTDAMPPWRAQPETNPNAADSGVHPGSLAYVIYTSGSTGKPKGVMIEHRSLVNRLVWMQKAYGLTGGDSVLQKTPFSFDVSVWEFFWPLITGARLVMARPEGHKDPNYLTDAISQYNITTLHFVPSMLQVFVDQVDAARCTSLVRVIASGEALPAALVRKFQERLPHVALHNLIRAD